MARRATSRLVGARRVLENLLIPLGLGFTQTCVEPFANSTADASSERVNEFSSTPVDSKHVDEFLLSGARSGTFQREKRSQCRRKTRNVNR